MELEDRYGRVATDLRVSLTDRCNLRCSYWMPAEGLDRLPNDDVLTDDEVVRLVRIRVELLGIREAGGGRVMLDGIYAETSGCGVATPRGRCEELPVVRQLTVGASGRGAEDPWRVSVSLVEAQPGGDDLRRADAVPAQEPVAVVGPEAAKLGVADGLPVPVVAGQSSSEVGASSGTSTRVALMGVKTARSLRQRWTSVA
jgi:hypothetical protein